MKRVLYTFGTCLALIVFAGAAGSAADPLRGRANNGAMLVQKNGCMGCHGAKFQGGIGPKLTGIQRRRSLQQIAEVLRHPRAPMPDFGFSGPQIDDIVAYLAGLDGRTGSVPVVTIDPAKPTDHAQITVRFAGKLPKRVVARAVMHMGAASHSTESVLHATRDRHIWQGELHFAMGGAWTIEVVYDGHMVDVPLDVAGT